MALPSTTAGITQMQNLTPLQSEITGDGSVGCAFACHQASTGNGDTAGNPCLKNGNYATPSQSTTANGATYKNAYCSNGQGTQIDNYALARYNNIRLRLDDLTSGISTLLNTAATTAQSSQFSTPPVYRFSIYSMDSPWQIGLTQLVPLTTTYQSQWTTASANFGVMEMYSNNADCGNAACSTKGSDGDVETNYDDSLGKFSQSSYIPNPGNGTNQASDTPQKVCSSSPTASRTNRAAAAAWSRRSTTSAPRLTEILTAPTGAPRSRTAGSRSRFFTLTTCRSRRTPGT